MTESAPSYEGDWRKKYGHAVLSAADAVARIQSGHRVFVGTGCSQPQVLVDALLARAGELEGVEIIQLLTRDGQEYGHQRLAEHFHIDSFFMTGSVRSGLKGGLQDYTPVSFSDIPKMFDTGRLVVDVALIQVTVPNEQGMCSLGISVDIVKSAARNAGWVIAQVNPRMPWTLGDSLIKVTDIDAMVPGEGDLVEIHPERPTEVCRRIAAYTAALIEDRSTVQLGMGRIPSAVAEFLKDKKDLGIHTVLLSDPVMDLVAGGAVTGVHKGTDRGKVVASCCLGTRRLYDYIHGNETFSFRPADYVSDPQVVSRQCRMVAVNTAVEVDLAGQVCAGSMEQMFFSGIGSHIDFARGAMKSPGGKVIVALHSTRAKGAISRIVPRLGHDSVVAGTVWDADYVVTEYGVAYLRAKTLQERALALISVAHPEFRADLLNRAITESYVSSDLAAVEGKVLVGPHELRATMVLDDGTQVDFRTMLPTDEKAIRSLYRSLSPKSLHQRFMSHFTSLPQKQVQNFIYPDYRSEMAIVATVPEAHGDQIIAVGRYYLDPGINRAELALTVCDEWQNRGIGTQLFRYLANVAERNGIAGFTAEVLADNMPMLAIFEASGCNMRSRLSEGVYSISLDFA
jgi:acyl-CoA hydrolase/GNAT superfamily N-acetyltransferase